MAVHELDYKVPQGKLLRVAVEHEGDSISRVRITGDFFLHPEEKILELEGCLRDIAACDVEAKVKSFFSHEDVTPIGFSPDDLVTCILNAMAQK